MSEIKFGTDGWRAVVGKDFNEENVRTVTKAIGKYVYDNFGLDKEIIVGYDPRNMALEYAEQSAEQLAEKVQLSPATIYRYEKGDIEKVPSDIINIMQNI